MMVSLRTLIFFMTFVLTQSSVNAQNNSDENGSLKAYDKIKVTFKNSSGRDIFVAIHYSDHLNGRSIRFETKAWYKIKKGEELYLFNTNNQFIYFYAETTKDFWGNQKIWKGNYLVNIGGRNYSFREYYMKTEDLLYHQDSNDWTFTLDFTK